MNDGSNRRNASVNFTSLAALNQRWCLQLKELQRIQNKLEEFLSRREAREIAAQVHDIALEIDEEIDQILQDPRVRRFYEYDGRFFAPKHGWGFHRAFDGVNVLRSLRECGLEMFFYGRQKESPIRWLMDELGKHIWEAKIRRINWQEFQTLSVIPKAVLSEIVREHARQSAEASAPLSPEEQTFFKPFEEQMKNPGIPV